MNINLKLLIATVLINTVSLNTPYCMEDETEYDVSDVEDVEDIPTIQQVLGMNVNFLDMNSKYNNNSTTDEEKQKLIATFCDCLLGNNGDNLKTILSYNIDYNDICASKILSELLGIHMMLDEHDIQEYLIKLLMANDVLYRNVLQIINQNTISGWHITEIKKILKDCISKIIKFREVEQKLNNLCTTIINGTNNNIEKNKYINEFFDYLLGEDWSNLKYVLQYSTDETLELITQVLDLSEVHKNLPIIRSNFIITLAKKYEKKSGAMYPVLRDMIRGESGMNALSCSRDELVDTIMEYTVSERALLHYNRNIKEVIPEYRQILINSRPNNNDAMKIINLLTHDNFEEYGDDMLYEYDTYNN